MTTPDPRALAERHGLSFHLEQRVPDHLTLVHHKQGCRPATDGETQLWTALARYALDREAECERLREVLRYYANEDGWTYDVVYEEHGYTSSAKRRAIDDDDVDGKGAGKRARAALLSAPPRGAATGDDDGA